MATASRPDGLTPGRPLVFARRMALPFDDHAPRTLTLLPPHVVRRHAGHFCAGLEIDATGRCVRATPILKWCVGMGRDDLRAEFEGRGYRATVVRRISSSASTATPNTTAEDGSGTLTA